MSGLCCSLLLIKHTMNSKLTLKKSTFLRNHHLELFYEMIPPLKNTTKKHQCAFDEKFFTSKILLGNCQKQTCVSTGPEKEQFKNLHLNLVYKTKPKKLK